MGYGRTMSMEARRVLAALTNRMGQAVDRIELAGLGVHRLRARIAELRFRGYCILCHEWREASRPGFRGSGYVRVDVFQLCKAAEFLGWSEPGDAEPPGLELLATFLRTACSLLGIAYDRLEKVAHRLVAGVRYEEVDEALRALR